MAAEKGRGLGIIAYKGVVRLGRFFEYGTYNNIELLGELNHGLHSKI
ncbi:hypothetical protein HCH_05477 [Hahella chejuensis KCTC 2396]|uniref:Uncharacterized protein n=1 Tax=Hahella chejuensis (strain KCTC 2396) TaxID=349521 RepID=Q2SB34_HAHCH|nr:hypothetical protein HCH_05477 [Hahella chejuensis KCTC 2396]